MNILGIETSCDETAVAVVADGLQVLSNSVYSQTQHHQPYGGVVPELASRQHVETLPDLLRQTIAEAGLDSHPPDALAVTYGPGLATALLIGVTAARALALRWQRPLYAVNHVEAHLYSLFLSDPDALGPDTPPEPPVLVLMVSGGHTALVRMEAVGQYHWLGQSLDDAAGEALDKGAQLMGLGYPGGPAIEEASAGGDVRFLPLPRVAIRPSHRTGADLDPDLCFSFSGLKTALLYALRKNPELAGVSRLKDVAASYQEAVFDALLDRVERAAEKNSYRSLGCVGGVARNRRLRARLETLARKYDLPLHLAPPTYCTDNAVMVAGLAGAAGGPPPVDPLDLTIQPNLRLASRESPPPS